MTHQTKWAECARHNTSAELECTSRRHLTYSLRIRSPDRLITISSYTTLYKVHLWSQRILSRNPSLHFILHLTVQLLIISCYPRKSDIRPRKKNPN